MGLVGPLLTVGATAYILKIKQWAVFHTIKLGFPPVEVQSEWLKGSSRGASRGAILRACRRPLLTVGRTAYLLEFKQWVVFHTIKLGFPPAEVRFGVSWRGQGSIGRVVCRIYLIFCSKISSVWFVRLSIGRTVLSVGTTAYLLKDKQWVVSLTVNKVYPLLLLLLRSCLLLSKCEVEFDFRSQAWPVCRIPTTEIAGPVTGS